VPAPLHFLPFELPRWDALALPSRGADAIPLPEALAIGIFTDERPLRGAAGLCDWRLCGRLSRLLRADKLSGRADEVVLLPPARARLPFSRLMLFGLGEQRAFDERHYRNQVARMREVLDKAGITSYALQPPGRSAGLIAARRALELWQEQTRQDGYEHEVTIIESPQGQKEMAEALRGRSR
jgi:leucyl aminopeptidase